MDKNRDDIIRKLFERSLEPKERGELNSCISSYMYVAFGVIICGERPSGSDLCCEYWISINGLSEISGWYKGDVGYR